MAVNERCHCVSSPKDWMVAEILDDIATRLNRKMKEEDHLDNAGSHIPLQFKSYSNVKFHYLPPNMTSVLQPLDGGIINQIKAG